MAVLLISIGRMPFLAKLLIRLIAVVLSLGFFPGDLFAARRGGGSNPARGGLYVNLPNGDSRGRIAGCSLLQL